MSNFAQLQDDTPAIGRIFDVDRLGLATYVLALIYLILSIYAINQLRKIHRVMRAGFDTQKLFHSFVTIHCLLRFISFGVLSLFNVLHEDNWYPATVFLFTLPEFFILSTYLLLYFQFLEVYIFAHDQYVISSRRAFRRQWLVVFFVATLLIYIMLSVLYVLLILRTEQVDDSVVELILYTTAIGCLVMPGLMLASAGWFSLLLLSGFTFSSELARQRVTKMNEVFGVWTLGRIARGIMLLLSILYRWQQTLAETYLGMVIVSVLLISEILPLMHVLDWNTIAIILFGEGSQSDDGAFQYQEIVGSPGGSRSPALSPAEALLGADSATTASTHDNGAGFHVGIGPLTASEQQGHVSFRSDSPRASQGEQNGTKTQSAIFPNLSTPLLSASSSVIAPTAAPKEIDIRTVQLLPASSASESFHRVYHSAEEAPPPSFTTLQRGVYLNTPVMVQSYLFPSHSASSESEESDVIKEVMLDVLHSSAVHHDHLVRVLGVARNRHNSAMLYVIEEFVAGGSLYERLHGTPRNGHAGVSNGSSSASASSGTPLDSLAILRLARHIAQGMEALHAAGVVHGHLKSSTVLLTLDQQAKVHDIGLRKMKAYAEVMLVQRQSHPAYSAPELLDGTHTPSPATDVFAFAVICQEMMTGQVPHQGRDLNAIYTAVVQNREHLRLLSSNETDLPPAFSKLVGACWNFQPTHRPTFKQIQLQLNRIIQERIATNHAIAE